MCIRCSNAAVTSFLALPERRTSLGLISLDVVRQAISIQTKGTQMIDHVYISVIDIDRSLAFYSEALKPLGWRVFGNYDAASGPKGVPDLYGIGDDVYGKGEAVGSSIWLRRRNPGETG